MGIKIEVTALVFSIGFFLISIGITLWRTWTKGPKISATKPRVTLYEQLQGAPATHSRNVNFHTEFRNKGDVRAILYYTVTLELLGADGEPVHTVTIPEKKDGNVRFEPMDLPPKAISPKGNLTFNILQFRNIKSCRFKIDGYYYDHKDVWQPFNEAWILPIEKTKIKTT